MVRLKNRYIVVEIISTEETDVIKGLNGGKLSGCLMDNVTRYYGEFGIAAITSGFNVTYCNSKTNIAIIRVRHGPHRFVTSIMPLITLVCFNDLKICGMRAKFRILYIGATIKHSNEFIIQHQQNYIDRMIGEFKGNKQEFIDDIMQIVTMGK